MSRLRITAFVVMAVAGVCIVLHENPRVPEVAAADARAFAGIDPKRITQEQRDAARRFANGRTAQDPRSKKSWFEVPLPRMSKAKYANIDLSASWNGTIKVLNQGEVTSYLGDPPTQEVTIGALNCGLQISGDVAVSGPPVEHDPHDSPWYEGDPGAWIGWYFPFTVSVEAPSEPGDPPATDSVTIYYWAGDEYDPMGPGDLTGPNKVYDDLDVSWNMAVSGIHPKAERLQQTLTTRQAMDWSDFYHEATWYAEEGAQITISATTDFGTISATGDVGLAGEQDLTAAAWILSGAFEIYYAKDDVSYLQFGEIKFNDVTCDTSNCNLSNPGTGDAPDATQANWKRSEDSNCARIEGDAGIYTYWTGTGNTTKTWGWTLYAPYAGKFIPIEGGHRDSVPYNGTDPYYTGPVIRWVDDGEGGKVSESVAWSGEYSYYQQRKSWELAYEWQTLTGTSAFTISMLPAWITANGEIAEEATAAICLPWIDSADFTSEPWTENLLSIAHAASVNINDPPGETRESLWVGSGGVTVNPADNDEWSVADGSSAPKVGRSLLTRKWLRLDRLSGGYNEGDEYYQDWPIMDKANLPIGTTLDDPDWHDSGSGGIDVEDVTHWADYAYLTLNITAPASGTIALVVSYSVAAIADPCYTCAGSRWEEFEYTRTYHTATYSVDVTSGTHTYLIDLCLPSQKFIPSYTYRMGTVDSLQFSLPANSSGSPQVWTLNSLNLAHDTGEGARTEPTYHVWFKYKRAWDWLNTDWNGISAVVDGKDALQLDYGYDSSYGKTRHEHGMLYIQRSEHCPGSESTTRLDSLKTIARLEDELNYQEGWTATDNLTVDSSANKDADDNRLASALYWFDLRQNHEWSFATSQDIDGAPCVETACMLAGITQHWYYYHTTRACGHGLITSTDGTQRQRSITDAARLYRLADGGSSWQFVESLNTDEHGRFRTSPLLEDGYSYQLESEGSIWTVANREYTTVSPQLDQYTPIHPHLADGYITDVHLWFVSDGNIYYKRKPTAAMVFQAPVCITSGYYPCGDVLPSGELLMAYQTPASQIAFKRSLKAGTIWEDTGVSVQGKYPILQQFNGIQYLVAYYSGIGQVIRRSQTRFSTLLTYNGATSALISAQTNAERVAFIKVDGDGNAMACAVPSGNSIRMYRSVNDGETWVQTI